MALAGIHMTDIPPLSYEKHLFHEKNIRSVTANTRADGHTLLRLAGEIPIRTHTETFPLESAEEALLKLKRGDLEGAAVLSVGR